MALQLILGRGEPVVPHFIMTQRLPTKQLLRLSGRAIHVLKYLEKAIHPRWPRTFEVAKRAVGVMVLLLTAVVVLTPVPLSNVAPAMVISLIALAYVEEDGLLLSVALLGAIILIGIASAAIWGTIVGAVLMHQLRPFLLDQFSNIVGDFGDIFRLKQELAQPFEILLQHDMVADNSRCVQKRQSVAAWRHFSACACQWFCDLA
jgi:hypothetical protein